jgi:mannose-6-phosphate isomerase-like protein (cupin superfamily)
MNYRTTSSAFAGSDTGWARHARRVSDRAAAWIAGGSVTHAHGVDEMFFVLSGTPTVGTPEGEEQLSPGDVVDFPEGPDSLHTFSNPTTEPVRLLGISTKRFPDVVPTRSAGWRGSPHAIPSARYQRAATKESSPALSCHTASEARAPGLKRHSRTLNQAS